MKLAVIFAVAGLLTCEALRVHSPLPGDEKKLELNAQTWEQQLEEPGGVLFGIDGVYHSASSSNEKKKLMKEAEATCTEENSKTLAAQFSLQKIKAGFNREPYRGFKSALSKDSFYGKHAQSTTGGVRVPLGCQGVSCRVPPYLAPRTQAKEAQEIPRIIWMTMSDKLLDGGMGPFQYRLLAEYFKKNPEYEFIVSGDQVSDSFMKSPEVKKEWQEAYTKARNGAEKADIWRYAVMYLYGGVYMDADCTAIAPFSEVIEKDAKFIQQFTPKSGGHGGDQAYESATYGMFFAPGNQLLEDLLDDIASKYTGDTATLSSTLTIDLTGPKALAQMYAKHAVCGIEACKGNTHKICGIKALTENSCVDDKLGKAILLWKDRDFNTGKVWHKSDVCAMSETRAKVPHWAQYSHLDGGKKFAEVAPVAA